MELSYRFHRLKSQALGRNTNISIPDTWECERLAEREWWCGDKALGTGLVFKSVFMKADPDTDGEMPSKDALATLVLGQLRAYFDTVDAVGEPDYTLHGDRQIVHVVIDFDDEDGPFRTYRWYLIEAFDDGVADIRFSLEIPRDRIDDPAHAELVEIFRAQVGRLVGWVDDEDGKPRLKRHEFDGRVAIRIPETWSVRREDDTWWCFDRLDRPGKLIMFWQFQPGPGNPTREELIEMLRDYIQQLMDDIGEPRGTLIERGLDIAGDNMFLYIVEDDDRRPDPYPDEDDGGPLRTHVWHVLRTLDDGLMHATAAFMIPISECDTPHYRWLVDVFEKAVPEAELR